MNVLNDVCLYMHLISLWAGIPSARDSVPEALVRILQSAEEHNLSPFDLKTTCLYQNIEINKNKYASNHVYICIHICVFGVIYVPTVYILILWVIYL